MELFIKCIDQTPIGHPVTLENLLMVYPNFDTAQPPDGYIKFNRAAVPATSSPFIIYECRYDVQGSQCNETYVSRLMTNEEKQSLFLEMQQSKPFPSWILNQETCNWEAPILYPADNNNKYQWSEQTQSWIIL
jgi:hypothetical protein